MWLKGQLARCTLTAKLPQFVSVGLLISLLIISPTLALQPQESSLARVTITVEKLDLFECDDVTTTPDPYVRVMINGENLNPGNREIDYYESPTYPRQGYSTYVNLAQKTVDMAIELYDADDPWSDDDHCDIFAGEGRNLALRLDLETCAITGDVTSQCNVYLETQGTGGEAATIGFRVDVDNFLTPGVQVRCTHDPIKPQPGDTVTISAEVFDDDFTQLAVSQVEIYVDPMTAPVATATNADWTIFSITPTVNEFSYYCRAVTASNAVEETPWHVVPVGYNRPVIPVVYTTENRTNALDVVFIADRNSYSGSNDTQFLTAVADMIRNGFYGENIFLKGGARTNFWIARDTGEVGPGDACKLGGPDHWGDSTFAFANVGVIVTTGAGGCARRSRRLLSVTAGDFNVVRHEVGHAPFGLADEYDKNGGSSCYFQPDPNPNIYETEGDCHDDLANLNRVGSTCRRFEVNYPPVCDGPGIWWTSEPATNDMMNDNLEPQAADLRSINYYFDQCGKGGC